MGKGVVSTQIIILSAFLIVAIMFMWVFTGSKIDPLKSPELEALQLSNKIAIFLNSMSTVEQGEVRIRIDKTVDVNIVHIGFSATQRLKNFFNALGQYEFKEGFSTAFTEKGYYVIVTPYRNETQSPFESSFILSYPREKENLEQTFLRPECLSVMKVEEKEKAEVSLC